MDEDAEDEENIDENDEDVSSIAADVRNYMTPDGFAALQEERRRLVQIERPKVVEVVHWAAGNGDRSENGDYIYGKKRLREIDRRLRYLTKRLDDAEIVDPARQQGLTQVFFGATVTYAFEDGAEQTVRLVGVDEADVAKGSINWCSAVAKALMKARVGDMREVSTGAGAQAIEVISISYPLA